MATAIGIDLGGTNIKGVLVNQEGQVLELHTRATDSFTDVKNDKHGNWKEVVYQMVNELKAKSQDKVNAIGLAAPGLPNDFNTAIRVMPGRLAGLENLIWSDYLQENQVWVLNDAHAALMAEVTFGAGKGVKNAVMLTLGTGVGGGILINGELYQGNFQRAGHIGHLALDAHSDELDITGIPGALEDAIGNASVAKRSFGRFASTYALLDAYRQGDALATYVWLNSVRKLAVGLCSLCNLLSPDVIILGGGITKAGDALYHPLADFMDVYEWKNVGKKTPVIQAHHGEMAGAIGAAGFAIRKLTVSGG
jgi:glucokinase